MIYKNYNIFTFYNTCTQDKCKKATKTLAHLSGTVLMINKNLKILQKNKLIKDFSSSIYSLSLSNVSLNIGVNVFKWYLVHLQYPTANYSYGIKKFEFDINARLITF